MTLPYQVDRCGLSPLRFTTYSFDFIFVRLVHAMLCFATYTYIEIKALSLFEGRKTVETIESWSGTRVYILNRNKNSKWLFVVMDFRDK